MAAADMDALFFCYVVAHYTGMEWNAITVVAVYLGIIAFGDTIVVPFALSGAAAAMDYLMIAPLTVAATLTSDSVLHLIGRVVTYDRLISWKFLAKRKRAIDIVSGHLQRRIFLYVFLSKFVYGTRAATQIAGGLKRVSYVTAMSAAVLGALGWLAVLLILHGGIRVGFSFFPQSEILVGVSIVVFVVIAMSIHKFISQRLRNRYFTSN